MRSKLSSSEDDTAETKPESMLAIERGDPCDPSFNEYKDETLFGRLPYDFRSACTLASVAGDSGDELSGLGSLASRNGFCACESALRNSRGDAMSPPGKNVVLPVACGVVAGVPLRDESGLIKRRGAFGSGSRNGLLSSFSCSVL